MRKKLIEVALPLEAINTASAREKSIRHGHPSTLHLWWARRPLAACRAVLFASLVDDPSSHPNDFPTEADQKAERERLFTIIKDLVQWENSNNERVLEAAREEIRASTGRNPPPILDPFCGGGSIPLEAQRLGLETHASDLNPVAVLITKALIEIPPKFANREPVNPDWQNKPQSEKRMTVWKGAAGLAADVRYYGRWMRDEAEKGIGHLYPKVKLPPEHGGGEATVIAWLWARAVKCPNPACGAAVPLAKSFWLSTKKERPVWVAPMMGPKDKSISFTVQTGKGGPPKGTVGRKGANCICCGASVSFNYIRDEGKGGRMQFQLMAIAAEGVRHRVYLSPTELHQSTALNAEPQNYPDTDLPKQALSMRVMLYGMDKHYKLFTARQLVALTTLSDLVNEVRERVSTDGSQAGMPGEPLSAFAGDKGITAYADAVATYLATAIDKSADFWSTIATWSSQPKNELVVTRSGDKLSP